MSVTCMLLFLESKSYEESKVFWVSTFPTKVASLFTFPTCPWGEPPVPHPTVANCRSLSAGLCLVPPIATTTATILTAHLLVLCQAFYTTRQVKAVLDSYEEQSLVEKKTEKTAVGPEGVRAAVMKN